MGNHLLRALLVLLLPISLATVAEPCCTKHPALYVFGASTPAGWNAAQAIALSNENSGHVFRGTVPLIMNYPHGMKLRTSADATGVDIGIEPGTLLEEGGSCVKCGISGTLSQGSEQLVIPGPLAAGLYSFEVDLASGTFSYSCAADCTEPGVFFPASPSNFQPRSQAFVHLFSWYWNDIAIECEEWLGPKGVTAVQVSPPQEHARGNSWSLRYSPVSYELNGNAGNETEFISMVNRCRQAGVDVYVDVILNHMSGATGDGLLGTGGTTYGIRTFPPVYGPQDFHHAENDPYANCQVQTAADEGAKSCDFGGLPDLRTESPHVQRTLAAYLNRLLDIGVAGFRIDAAQFIAVGDLSAVFSYLSKQVFRFAEAFHPLSSEYTSVAFSTEGGYRTRVREALTSSSGLSTLLNDPLGARQRILPSQSAVVYVVNHDGAVHSDVSHPEIRYTDAELYSLANILMLALPYGFPKVLSSFDFQAYGAEVPKTRAHSNGSRGPLNCGSGQPWVCEHRWSSIANMFAWRRSAGDNVITKYSVPGGRHVHFCRGAGACIAVNSESVPWTVDLQLTLTSGSYCNVIVSTDANSCPTVTVNNGIARVTVPAMGAVALHSGAKAESGPTPMPSPSPDLPPPPTPTSGPSPTPALSPWPSLSPSPVFDTSSSLPPSSIPSPPSPNSSGGSFDVIGGAYVGAEAWQGLAITLCVLGSALTAEFET